MWTKMLINLLFYLFSTVLSVAFAIDETLSGFTLKHRTAITPSSGLAYDVRAVSTRLRCAASCMDKPTCKAFYAIAKDNAIVWDCWLMDDRVSEDSVSSGEGTYGYLYSFKATPISLVPSFANCNIQLVTRTDDGIAAVYDCSRQSFRMTNIGVLYDEDKNQWPTLNSACSSNIAAQLGLAGTLMKITESATKTNSFDFQFFCQKDEYHWGDAECDGGGVWTFSGTVDAGCISTTCMKNNIDLRGLYKGTLAVAKGVFECQYWTSQTPNHHYRSSSNFLLDNQDMSAAKNYCRDPDKSKSPWCFTLDGPRWTLCNIPRCERAYINLIG